MKAGVEGGVNGDVNGGGRDGRSLAAFREADDVEAARRLAICLAGVVASWAAMAAAMRVHYGLTLLLAPVAALFFTQLFIYQHDMGHGSFFRRRWLNDVVGVLVCVPLMTPYWEWRESHRIHHRGTGKLEERKLADLYTMTAREWRAAPSWQRAAYRLFRSPFLLCFVAPLWTFLIGNRIKGSMCKGLPRGRNLVNVWFTTAAFLALAAAVASVVGWQTVVAVQLPILSIGGAIGLWLFYLQHNFEHTWWTSAATLTHEDAALKGSSFCVMPPLLAWFMADTGYHHVHHLDPKIPTYRLRACHDAHPERFGAVRPITVAESLRGLWSLRVYDEDRARLISFADADADADAAGSAGVDGAVDGRVQA